jgi:hypothetical protein
MGNNLTLEGIRMKDTNIPKKRLDFFLRFANLDIASLDNSRLFNTWVDLRRIAFGSLGPFAIYDRDLIEWHEKRKQGEKIQGLIRSLLNKIFTVSLKPKKIFIKPLFSVSEEMERILEEPEDEKTKGVEPAMGDIIFTKFKKQPISKWSKDYLVRTIRPEFHILAGKERVTMFCPDIEEKILIEFVSALSHFPLSSIKRCQWCNEWFLQPGKKEKNFCSTRHYFSWAQRERRKRLKKAQEGRKVKRGRREG